MPATTTQGVPYPLGTDRVMDGDNAIQALAQWVDNSICFGAAYTNAAGPGVGGTMWFNSQPIALGGGCALGGTFPVTGITVPRKGWYQLHAVANMQSTQAGVHSGRLFIGDSGTAWCEGYVQIQQPTALNLVSAMTVRQLNAGQVVYWGMTAGGVSAVGVTNGPGQNSLSVRLLVPLP